jgi:hypothetical protein
VRKCLDGNTSRGDGRSGKVGWHSEGFERFSAGLDQSCW